jgi:hypothetical protein
MSLPALRAHQLCRDDSSGVLCQQWVMRIPNWTATFITVAFCWSVQTLYKMYAYQNQVSYLKAVIQLSESVISD